MAYSRKELETALARAGAPKNAIPTLTAIAGAESSFGANPYGDRGLGAPGFTSFGPWQIHTPAHPQYSQQQLVGNLNYSAAAAVQVYKEQGFGAWTTYKTGAYKKFTSGGGESFGDEALHLLEGPLGPETESEKELNKYGESINPLGGIKRAIKTTGEVASIFGKIGETAADWIEEPLTPIKFVGGAVLLYIGIRTLTGGSGYAREGSRFVQHATEAAAVIK